MDFETELAAPLGEGAFGNTEFGRDTREAAALRTELDEFVNCFLIFHLSVDDCWFIEMIVAGRGCIGVTVTPDFA
jgi:hypothetical protein